MAPAASDLPARSSSEPPPNWQVHRRSGSIFFLRCPPFQAHTPVGAPHGQRLHPTVARRRRNEPCCSGVLRAQGIGLDSPNLGSIESKTYRAAVGLHRPEPLGEPLRMGPGPISCVRLSVYVYGLGLDVRDACPRQPKTFTEREPVSKRARFARGRARIP